MIIMKSILEDLENKYLNQLSQKKKKKSNISLGGGTPCFQIILI